MWTTSSKHGVINNTTTQMEYMITQLGNTPTNVYTSCVTGTTTIDFPRNDVQYEVVVRQFDNIAINKHFNIRKAPFVNFHHYNGSKTNFYIYDILWRQIVTGDTIEVQLKPGAVWMIITTGYTILNKDLDTTTVYARRAATLAGDGVTIDDPASFPYKVEAYYIG
jgi:hypothetical protein